MTDRRQFLLAGGVLAATAASGPAAAQALPFFITRTADRLLPKSAAPRVVICGGGWGGLMAAAELRRLAPQLEVVLLERNPVFFSCPMSNKWLVGAVDTDFLVHDYLRVADRRGYRFIQTEILGVDRGQRVVQTALGTLDYDYLILSPGIRYNYEAWFGNDKRMAEATRARAPAAYIPNAEHFALKRAIQGFEGGHLVMTLPPPPQRCPPSPYERACLIAWYFKTHKIKARITILDHKDGIRPLGLGFRAAFDELYGDIITYVPNAHIREVDPFNKRIKTAAGDLTYDYGILMAPHQAGELAWKAGAVGTTPEGKPSGWADVDPLFLNLKDDPNVYVIGDAVGVVSPLFRFYPKSGHIANRHARTVARYIAEREAGRVPVYGLPDNLCYMWVNGAPREAINVQFDYALNAKGVIEQTQVDDDERRAELVPEDFAWAGGMFEAMFG